MARTLLSALNESNPNKVSDALRDVKAGTAFLNAPSFIDSAVSSDTIILADGNKAALGLAAFASAGGATGPLAFVAGGAPVAGEFSVTPAGDLIFAAADAVTRAEVYFIAVQGEVFTESLEVAASSAAFSSGRKGAVLLSATITAGLALGPKTPVARGSAPAAGEAAIAADGLSVAFNVADVVAGSATVTYIVTPGSGGTSSVFSRLTGSTAL